MDVDSITVSTALVLVCVGGGGKGNDETGGTGGTLWLNSKKNL